MSSSSTPIMDVMSQAIIPAVVQPIGPHFSKLPSELLIEIFKFILGIDPIAMIFGASPQDKVMLVCKTFFKTYKLVFYGCQTFNPSVDLFRSAFTPPTRYLFPPVTFRNMICRLKITVELKDYLDTNSGTKLISNIEELFRVCPGAHILRDLTDDWRGGFGSLQLLELVVLTDYKFASHIRDTTRVLREARFDLNATNVYVLAVCSGGSAVEQYHVDVVEAILGR